VPLGPRDLLDVLGPLADQMAQAALETVLQANVAPAAVTHLVFVGGSSLMGVTRAALGGIFGQAQVHHGSALTAIVDGLSRAAEGAFEGSG